MTGRPRPVLTVASFTSLGTALAGIASFLGYAQASDQIPGIVQGVGTALIAVLALTHVGVAAVAQAKVTPLEDPRDNAGRPLIPVTGPVAALEPVTPAGGGPAVAAEPTG